ncbi:transcription factor TFIIH complex subunit Tfb5-domain-containing protein [Stachybotrys elegans]|uniref:General transcription and DNA repair factor IIH subunit TFB5 n=1 Tax=Stachybotrys elegans TaxID=80388 RepID=A0A8K0SYW2_9HYPO|nr:transcription factor TFIIH complex subunit Tfb5-domain-containing protein [Stachybotrys elegans]
MPRAIRGVLIECDPSIKSIIVKIDSDNHDYIIEDLDEERVVVKENMVALLKAKLEDKLKENLPPRKNRAPNKPHAALETPTCFLSQLCPPA